MPMTPGMAPTVPNLPRPKAGLRGGPMKQVLQRKPWMSLPRQMGGAVQAPPQSMPGAPPQGAPAKQAPMVPPQAPPSGPPVGLTSPRQIPLPQRAQPMGLGDPRPGGDVFGGYGRGFGG